MCLESVPTPKRKCKPVSNIIWSWPSHHKLAWAVVNGYAYSFNPWQLWPSSNVLLLNCNGLGADRSSAQKQDCIHATSYCHSWAEGENYQPQLYHSLLAGICCSLTPLGMVLRQTVARLSHQRGWTNQFKWSQRGYKILRQQTQQAN